MNLLFFSDIHITDRDLKECSEVLKEIISIAKEHKVEKIYNLGDTFDQILPSSSAQDLYASFIKEINLPIIQIIAQSHESENLSSSVLNHYAILNNQITSCKEWIDNDYLYCGHFGLIEAKKCYGGTKSKSELSKYKYNILGHFHSFELVKPNCCQLGAVRWVDFAEAQDEDKVILIIKNYKEENEKCIFIPLKTPYKMYNFDVNSNDNNKLDTNNSNLPPHTEASTLKSLKSQGENPLNPRQKMPLSQVLTQLDQLNASSKVRIIFYSYSDYREWLGLKSKYDNKFAQLKIEKKFNLINQIETGKKNEIITFQKCFEEWLNKQTIDEQVKRILLE